MLWAFIYWTAICFVIAPPIAESNEKDKNAIRQVWKRKNGRRINVTFWWCYCWLCLANDEVWSHDSRRRPHQSACAVNPVTRPYCIPVYSANQMLFQEELQRFAEQIGQSYEGNETSYDGVKFEVTRKNVKLNLDSLWIMLRSAYIFWRIAVDALSCIYYFELHGQKLRRISTGISA